MGLLPMLAIAGLAGLAGGLSVARPAFAPIALLLCAQAAAWVLIVQHASCGLRAAGLVRPALAVSALAAFVLAVLLKQTGRPLLYVVGGLLREWLPYSPTTFGAFGLLDPLFDDVIDARPDDLLREPAASIGRRAQPRQ